jgi:hypothetical protein
MCVGLWESIEVNGLGLYLRDEYIRPNMNPAVEHSGAWTSDDRCRRDVESICAIKWIDDQLRGDTGENVGFWGCIETGGLWRGYPRD